MNNPQPSLKDRIVIRLMSEPEVLNMSEFSILPRRKGTRGRRASACGTTLCLAGLILDESGVSMAYSPCGIAIGLREDETPPSLFWLNYECSLSDVPVDPQAVVIAAKARELWAAQYGELSARRLMFYGPEWGVKQCDLHKITAHHVIEFLQAINRVVEKA